MKRMMPADLMWDWLAYYFGIVTHRKFLIHVSRQRDGRIRFSVAGVRVMNLGRFPSGRPMTSEYCVHRVFCPYPVKLCPLSVAPPLKNSTPPGIVADWLADNGHEDTPLYRFLMWCHWNLWEG